MPSRHARQMTRRSWNATCCRSDKSRTRHSGADIHMIGRRSATIASLGLTLVTSGCLRFLEVPVETPGHARLDMSPFHRVLVAGFLSSGTDLVDANLETVRLLRSQLRSKTGLHVIDADVLPLVGLAETGRTEPGHAPEQSASATTAGAARHRDGAALADDESIFGGTAFWKRIGEEYQEPLIVTGSLRFASGVRFETETPTEEQFDALGRRSAPVVRRDLDEQAVFTLVPTFVFIDGRTGAILHRESFVEQVTYEPTQKVPPLSAYFELMDRVVPAFLRILSDQRIQNSRFLLR